MSDNSTTTITGTFATRQGAELALEHLVQEYGVARGDVFIEPVSDENSAGETRSGGDRESADPQSKPDKEPALNGALRVSADISNDKLEEAEESFRQAGASHVARK
jgi:hypothetical protein